MDNSKEVRGTGRSQRDIVRALSLAIMGKRVLFVSANQDSGRDHWKVAMDWLGVNGFIGYTGCGVSTRDNFVRMGAGSVTFSMGVSMSGPRLYGIQHIVEDHFVTECNAAKAAKDRLAEEQEADKNTIAKLLRKHQWTRVLAYGPQFHNGDITLNTIRLNLNERAPE